MHNIENICVNLKKKNEMQYFMETLILICFTSHPHLKK